MVKSLLLSRCAKKVKQIFLVATILMEIFDIVVDSMEASDYQGGKSLHLSKPKTEAVVAFIVLACTGAIFSVLKVIFATYHYRVMQREKEECNSTYYQEIPINNLETEDGIEQKFGLINIAIKSFTLIFEDVAQAALPYWFVTRCSVDFDSIVKICFICVCPILNFAYFSFIVIRIVWNYRGKHKSKLRITLIFLLLINIIPLGFGILSSKVAFDRTHLIGDVPEIELVQREGAANGSSFKSSWGTEILKKKSLYAIWQIIEGADNHCANFSLKCKNGSFFGNDIFNGCLEVRFILCYDSARLNIVYRIQICQKSRLNCHNTPLNKTGLSLKYTSDFCGESEADPEQAEFDSIQYQ